MTLQVSLLEPTVKTFEPLTTDDINIQYELANNLLKIIESGQKIDKPLINNLLSDLQAEHNNGTELLWKERFDSVETAFVLFLVKYGHIFLSDNDKEKTLNHFIALENLEPTQTYRSDTQLDFQQFSTPLPLTYIVNLAANPTANDIVLEPSAGTGLLTAMTTNQVRQLILNEIENKRADLLKKTYQKARILTKNATSIHHHLGRTRPTLVMMNPPFSRQGNKNKIVLRNDIDHIYSAYQSLAKGGRLVAITSETSDPNNTYWQKTFSKEALNVKLSVPINDSVYKKHGVHFEIRLTVLDKPHDETICYDNIEKEQPRNIRELLNDVKILPPRTKIENNTEIFTQSLTSAITTIRKKPTRSTPDKKPQTNITPLLYTRTNHNIKNTKDNEQNFLPYEPQAVIVEGISKHPTPLMQTAAMAAVEHPDLTYRPLLPEKTINNLSDAQIESVVLAGESHSNMLQWPIRINQRGDETINAKADDADKGQLEIGSNIWSSPVQPRFGWFLGDDTGTGKGRQVAAIIMDNFMQGRNKALWLSESADLLEDARRDWEAIGGDPNDIKPFNKINLGEDVPYQSGILFVTYATMRGEKPGKANRLETLIAWLGNYSLNNNLKPLEKEKFEHAFDGIIAFDECHAMANAIATITNRGASKPSLQGIAGLCLQNKLPNARVVYVSATGATKIESLAYASRLGLWGSKNTPFTCRENFIADITKGGIAALEILARDLKALGLYQARTMSYEGVEIETIEHQLTEQQEKTYDTYADAFQIIHNNIEAALKATGITNHKTGKSNGQAKSAAMSAFEGTKQRFFSHMLNSMKTPSLIKAIEKDLKEDKAVVVQIISTGEAVTTRRLDAIPTSEWSDIQVDCTPREYVIEYLKNSFPINAYETVIDPEGNERQVMLKDDNGNPIISQKAVEIRNDLILEVAMLPGMPNALDVIIQHFGHDNVAEITKRSRRIIKIEEDNHTRYSVQKRPGNANIAEVNEFMAGNKNILVFSQAGGTGRSYHADRNVPNQRMRRHYLLEAGWRADKAIQGLGRTHRTNQAQPPVFIPVTTNVKGERRFISTIAKRLDSLGAITRGQRDAQTSRSKGKQLFSPKDNFESIYARQALHNFYYTIINNNVPEWPLSKFEKLTGLKLKDKEGKVVSQFPPMSRCLNRLLALELKEQNFIFELLEDLIDKIIQTAIDTNTYDKGIEYIKAESLKMDDNIEIYQHPDTHARTLLTKIKRKEIIKYTTAEQIKELYNAKSADKDGHNVRMLVSKHGRSPQILYFGFPTMDSEGRLFQHKILEGVRYRRTIDYSRFSDIIHGEDSEYKITDDKDAWLKTWNEFITNQPTLSENNLWIVTGILLPIWQKLPSDSIKIHRLITDEKEHMIGRVFSDLQASNILKTFNIEYDIPMPPAEELYDMMKTRKMVLTNNDNINIESRYIGGQKRITARIESSRTLEKIRTLKDLGCLVEYTSGNSHLVVPNHKILDALIKRLNLTIAA